MKQILDDKSFLKIAMFSGFIAMVMGIIKTNLLSIFFTEVRFSIIFQIILIFLFYGFVILAKKEKNKLILIASYIIIVREIIYPILKYGLNMPLPAGITLDWILFLIFGLSLYKIKNIETFSKVTSGFIIIISLGNIFLEGGLETLLGTYIWSVMLVLMYALLAATLYLYLQSMKPRRRKK